MQPTGPAEQKFGNSIAGGQCRGRYAELPFRKALIHWHEHSLHSFLFFFPKEHLEHKTKIPGLMFFGDAQSQFGNWIDRTPIGYLQSGSDMPKIVGELCSIGCERQIDRGALGTSPCVFCETTPVQYQPNGCVKMEGKSCFAVAGWIHCETKTVLIPGMFLQLLGSNCHCGATEKHAHSFFLRPKTPVLKRLQDL